MKKNLLIKITFKVGIWYNLVLNSTNKILKPTCLFLFLLLKTLLFSSKNFFLLNFLKIQTNSTNKILKPTCLFLFLLLKSMLFSSKNFILLNFLKIQTQKYMYLKVQYSTKKLIQLYFFICEFDGSCVKKYFLYVLHWTEATKY